MTYSQWLRQKTIKERDSEEEKPEKPRPSFRYPIGRIIHVDNRSMFDHFSTVKS